MMHSVNMLVVHCADYDAVSPASVVAYVAAAAATQTEDGSKGSQVGAGLEPSPSNKEQHNKGGVGRAGWSLQHQPWRPGRGSRGQRRGC